MLGRLIALAHIEEQEERVSQRERSKQDHGRLRWRRTDFSTAKGSSLAFSTQFLPRP